MENLLRALLQIPEVSALAEAVESGGCPAAVTGLSPVHRAQIAAALSHRTGRPLVMVCADETRPSAWPRTWRLSPARPPAAFSPGSCSFPPEPSAPASGS